MSKQKQQVEFVHPTTGTKMKASPEVAAKILGQKVAAPSGDTANALPPKPKKGESK